MSQIYQAGPTFALHRRETSMFHVFLPFSTIDHSPLTK